MNNQELVSVIVAVYNMENLLERCVESVLSQTYDNIEILLVNDGSKDSSLDICRKFERADNRVKVIDKENGGLTSARKAGFDNSSGKYIAFIDSDDYLEKDYIAKHYDNIKSHNAQISICCYFLEIDEVPTPIVLRHEKDEYDQSELVQKLFLPGVYPISEDKTKIPNFLWLRLFDRSIISESCFVSENEVYTEDLFFNGEAYLNCKKIAISDSCLYHYCMNSDSLTHVFREKRYDMEIGRIKKIKEFLKKVDMYDENRIYLANLRLIWGCVDNAMKLGSFKKFRQEVKPIFNNDELHKMPLNSVLKFASKGDKACYFFFKFKSYIGAYCFKKIVYGRLMG